VNTRSAWWAVAALAIAAGLPGAARTAELSPAPRLDFQVDDGLNLNRLMREGEVAAHLLLRSGRDPRILIAFPAGDSGVGLWFAERSDEVHWLLAGAPQPVQASDREGRALRGIVALVSVTAPDLEPRQAVVSSIRVLRDYQQTASMPPSVSVAPRVEGRSMVWSRDRLDGAAGYRLELEVTHGELQAGHFRAAADGTIGLRITGLTGEPPLTPLSGNDLLTQAAAPDSAARNTLSFLSYREKFLAGSWRFDTYFGRDTLMSVRLLLPALSPTAVEAGLASVLARLSPEGEVAHEEDIGEQAVLDHLKENGTRSAAPVYDYKMIDGSYLLAPVIAEYLLHDERGRARAAGFLAAEGRGAALVRNLRLVIEKAAAFAADPGARQLIGLKPGFAVGEWRDSGIGLGGGRYPYDVDAVLVPAALAAAAELNGSGLLAPFSGTQDRALLARAASMARVWRERAPPLFDVSIPNREATAQLWSYATAEHVSALPALASLGAEDLRFHALALSASGAPVRVVHSDEGFALLFAEPDPQALDRAVTASMRPFPAGLMTEVGLLVANPAYSTADLRARLNRNAYHGTVVWSWQQALFAAGLARQLARTDLPPQVRAHLSAAQRTLWKAIAATRSLSNSELWSWSFSERHYHVAPFGAAAADADESNAAQLWSTVYLAVRPPPAVEKAP
jgi:glycogen debranching enzyme